MKRRIVSLLLCFALGTVLMACGGGKETTDTDNTTEAESDDTATVSSSSEEESKYTEIDPWEYLWGYFSENEDGTYKYNGYPLAVTKEGLDGATQFSYQYYGDREAVAGDENLLIE